MDSFGNVLEMAVQERKELVVMGDLNCAWLSLGSSARALQSLSEEFNLQQIIKSPMRITDHSATLIDLLLATSPESFQCVGTAPIAGSDHLMIYGERVETVHGRQAKRSVRSYKKCDCDKLVSDLQDAPWHVMSIFDSIDEKWEYWKSLFISILNKHAPLVTVRTRNHSLPWVSAQIRNDLRNGQEIC